VEEEATMTPEQAKAEFRALILQYGLQWTAKVPKEGWERMEQINRSKALTIGDRMAIAREVTGAGNRRSAEIAR
jgi:hypothetical protein